MKAYIYRYIVLECSEHHPMKRRSYKFPKRKMKHVQKRKSQIGIRVLIRITKAKRQREMSSGSNGEIIFSPQVVSCQPCNQQQQERCHQTCGRSKDIIRNLWVNHTKNVPFLQPFLGNYLKIGLNKAGW